MTSIHQEILNLKLTPNQFFMLLEIRDNPLSMHMWHQGDYQILLNMELITMILTGGHESSRITKAGEDVLRKVENLFKPQKKGTPAQILGEGYQEKIQEYLEIFPKIKLPSGKAARSDKKNVETSLAWFVSTYDYSWDIILKATQNYVAEYELKNYMYMQTSQYFIRKQQSDKSWGSELANRCSEIATGSVIAAENHFKDRVV